jgi:plasmid maintenance system antidote protein VapI
VQSSPHHAITIIERYLAEHRLSRGQLAVQVGISESLLHKLLSGQGKISPRTLIKISAKTGLEFEARKASFDFDLHQSQRADVGHLEGSYQTIRPSFRTVGGIQCFETLIYWDDASHCLAFKELDNDLSPGNAGCVSVPLYQRIIYMLSAKQGNFRLAALSDAYEPGVFYGGLLTVASKTMVTKAPAAAIFVISKVANPEEIIRGVIEADHPSYAEFSRRLCFAKAEGFFEIFGWPSGC